MRVNQLLRLAAVSLPYVADRTCKDLAAFWKFIVPDGLDLVALPMQCVTGADAESAPDCFSALAAQSEVHLIANLDLHTESGVQNTSILYGPDGAEIGRYVKSHQLPYENFALGDDLPVFETAVGKIGMIAGTDHYFPEIMEVMSLKGAEYIVHSHAPEPVRDTTIRATKLCARAMDDKAYVISAEYGPTEMYEPFHYMFHNPGGATGRSMVADPMGHIVAITPFEPGIAIATVPRRHRRNVWHDIRGISTHGDNGLFDPICSMPSWEEGPLPARPVRIGLALTPRHRLYSVTEMNAFHLDYLLRLARKAAVQGIDLLALGEFIFGDTSEAATRQLAALAREHNCYVSVAGFGIGRPAHALLFGRDGSIAGRYNVVTDGATEFPVFDTDIGRIAMKVCRDNRQQELDRVYGLKCADLVLWPTMAGEPTSEALALKNRGRAIDNGSHILITTYNSEGDPSFRSILIDPYGRQLYSSTYMQEGVDLIQVVLEKQAWYDPNELGSGPMSDSPLREPAAPKLVPAFKHNFRQVLLSCRRPELYGPITTYERSAFGHHQREVGPLIMEQFKGCNP
jgi:predicted amidohydrolase